MQKHTNIVAALHIGLGALCIFIAIFLFFILYFAGRFVDDNEVQFILPLIGKIILIFLTVIGLPGIIAGIGLFKRKEWARILALVISVMALLNFPFGTALGVYSVWALTQTEIISQFEKKNDSERN